MLLNQLVKINEAALVADAVNFDMMDDAVKNLSLCKGFIFNYDPSNPKSSTVGILDALRSSYRSRNEPNIHLLVQDYGKGKSHFGLVVANFFKQPYESPEVQGILHQIETAVSSNFNFIVEGIKGYKKRSGKHLVICLSGEQGDLKQLFLRSLRKALEAEGITDSIAKHICSEPLRYLEGLNGEKRATAENFLVSTGNQYGDINALSQLLRDDNYKVVSTVVDISRELEGFPFDFEADLRVEDILEDLLKNLCSGENPRFQGILILLDELYAYLQSWATNPAASGGHALQNITNVCERHKGRIALISFTQIKPSNAAAVPLNSQDDYRKLTSRLELNPSTYEPISSLELVLENLIIPQTDAVWQQFLKRWINILKASSESVYEKRIPIYRQRNWTLDKFQRHLVIGCFPLHTVTSSLLCNLEFTQGRTAIQFIKEDVKKFISTQPVEVAEKLNYIYPVALVDAFTANFSNYPVYKDYKKAYDSIIASAEPDELTVLKALFLFYASSSNLTKSDREGHEEILSILAGLSTLQTKKALDTLEQTRRVIYKLDNKTYGFYSGFGIVELEQQIEAEVKGKNISVDSVAEYFQRNLEDYLGSQTIVASQFVDDNKLVSEDWKFEYKVYTIRKLEQALSSKQTLAGIQEKGILVYAIAQTAEELQALRQRIDTLLTPSPIKHQIVVAISSQTTEDIGCTLLKINALERKSAVEKQVFGPAAAQLLQQWNKNLNTQIKRLLQECTYHSIILDSFHLYERNKPELIISALLQELYCFVPPVAKIEKMGSRSTAGSKIIGFASKRILENNLIPGGLPDKSYVQLIESILITGWGLLRRTSQNYLVEVPSDNKVRAAWDKISEMTALGEQQKKEVELTKIWDELSKPPYGYNEYTFTILCAGWLAYHRTEVFLKGSSKIPEKKTEQVFIQNKPIRDWANTNILDKPKDFVNVWIINQRAKLIRRQLAPCPEIPLAVDYTQAQQYLQEIDTFLESGDPDGTKFDEIKIKQEQLTAGIAEIDEWFKPVEAAARLKYDESLEDLTLLYSALVRQLPKGINTDGVTVVSPTEQQCDRQAQALKAVYSKIESKIAKQNQRSQSLAREEDYVTYKLEVQGNIDKLRGVSDLPPHFKESLEEAARTASSRQQALKEQAKVSECLSKIRSLFNGLGSYPTQDDYLRISSEIENLVQEVPAAREESDYRQTIQALNQQQQEVTTRLEKWQQESAEVTSRERAVKLREEIISQRNRFTESNSKQKLKALLNQLDGKVIELGSKEEAEAQLRNMLQSAQQKLQRIKDLPNLPDAFQVYQELATDTLPEHYQQQLQLIQSEGRAAVYQKFTQLSNRQLERLEDYQQLKELLETSQRLLSATEDFAEIRVSLERALTDLDSRREELQKRRQDKQTIQTIRQHQSEKDNTIRLCQGSIKAIEELQHTLNYPEQFKTEIEQRLQKYRKQVAEYRGYLQSLRDRLSTVQTLNQLETLQTEYIKLDLVFKDSADYPGYQQLQATIQHLREDLERMRNLENLRSSDTSITRCHESLKIISDEQANFHDLERFQPKLTKLQEHLNGRVQAYITAAGEWLKQQEERAARLPHLTDNSEKLQLANNLLKQIQSQKHQYIELLSSEHQQTLGEIEHQYSEIQNHDRESRILVLFQELPLEQRQNLYYRLSAYLQNPTEK